MKVSERYLSDFFTPVRGLAKYTKKYSDEHPGEYPVYSASANLPLGYIDSFDYAGGFLTFTTNGYGGVTRYIEHPFSANADRAVLVPKDGITTPNRFFMQFVIEQALRPLAHGRRAEGGKNEYTKVSPKTAQNATIKVIEDEEGNLDYHAMNEIGIKIRKIKDLQYKLTTYLDTLDSFKIKLETPNKTKTVSLGDANIFKIHPLGKRHYKSQLNSEGKYPVFSANVQEPMGYIDKLPDDQKNFNREFFIWGIDGNFDWNLMPAGSPFIATDHCGRMQILNKDIDSQYALYTLRAKGPEMGFTRVYRANNKNILNVEIDIPIDSQGNFDLREQQRIALKYHKVNIISKQVRLKLEEISSIKFIPNLLV